MAVLAFEESEGGSAVDVDLLTIFINDLDLVAFGDLLEFIRSWMVIVKPRYRPWIL